MVLVVISRTLRNMIFGKPRGDKSALLPVSNESANGSEILVTRRGSGAINNGDEVDDGSAAAGARGGGGGNHQHEEDTDREDGSSTTSDETAKKSASRGLSEGAFVPPRVLSDIVIGLSDGLTVPFALTAGLSSLGSPKLVITGGLAELVSGAISMGLGGYLAAVGESEYYQAQAAKEKTTYENSPLVTLEIVQEALDEFKLSESTKRMFVQDLERSPDELLHFVMRVGRGMEEPANSRQFTSALTIGLSYFVGGFIPLIPYFFTKHSVNLGLIISAVVMAGTLFLFGAFKTVISIGTRTAGPIKIIWDGIKMMLLGGVAAGCAYGMVRAIDHDGSR